MNKDLYGKNVIIPDAIKKHLKDSLNNIKGLDQTSEGYRRNIQLQNAQTIGYPQLKRIKNFFDTFQGDTKDADFLLNGGMEMKSWVDTTLQSMRSGVETTKRNKKQSGMSNQYIRPHEKNNNVLRPSKKHLKVSQRHATSIGNLPSPVMEQIDRIKELILKNI